MDSQHLILTPFCSQTATYLPRSPGAPKGPALPAGPPLEKRGPEPRSLAEARRSVLEASGPLCHHRRADSPAGREGVPSPGGPSPGRLSANIAQIEKLRASRSAVRIAFHGEVRNLARGMAFAAPSPP